MLPDNAFFKFPSGYASIFYTVVFLCITACIREFIWEKNRFCKIVVFIIFLMSFLPIFNYFYRGGRYLRLLDIYKGDKEKYKNDSGWNPLNGVIWPFK